MVFWKDVLFCVCLYYFIQLSSNCFIAVFLAEPENQGWKNHVFKKFKNQIFLI